MEAKVLIVEDQFIEANNLQRILEQAGYRVSPIARSVPIALEIIDQETPDLVLLDIRLQGNLTGIDLAKILRERNMAFVFISANSDKQILNAAKQTRPYGFLVKPFREKDVLVMLDVAWYLHKYNQKGANMEINISENPVSSEHLQKIIGKSQLILDVLENIKLVSQSDTSVLITGESGTGKELIAQAIHRTSKRKNKPLVVVNCAALPAYLIESELFGHEKGSFTGAINRRIGKFEQADGGTIFLDEIGELPLDQQVKFLRVLQEKETEPIGGKSKKIDVRIIAATNRNLEDEVAYGRFRIDLYYRLNIFPIFLPPLRERKSDIILLANYFLNKYAQIEGKRITGFTDQVVASMLAYSWPGNIRELENLMARSVLLSMEPVINSLILPRDKNTPMPVSDSDLVKTMEESERDHIQSVLEKCNWKVYGKGAAAELLGLKVSTLNSRIKKLGIIKGQLPPTIDLNHRL